MRFTVVSNYSGHAVPCADFAEAIAFADLLHCRGSSKVVVLVDSAVVVVLRGRTDRRD